MTEHPNDYDVVVVGSGFGGSVAALRLTEKGYRVAVVEAGRRFTDESLPATSWDLRRFLWAPKLGLRGIQRIHVLDDVVVLAGAGVGGGSLVYANTLYEPLDPFYADPQWAHITDWRSELAPFYAQAARMLGVVTNPTVSPSDEAMRDVAEGMGVGSSFRLTPVGVFFGETPGALVEDPYFGGAGPARRGCIECGECMIGCRHGAKNRLDRNYLALAERGGAVIIPDMTVTSVRPVGDGYAVDAVRTGRWSARRPDRVFTAREVVFAAGTYGTQQLLHALRDTGVLPRISPRLGELTRTNSEALLGAKSRRKDADFTRGVAITSSFHPDDVTHIEPVRYGKGSNAMGLLSTLMVDGDGRLPRWLVLLATMLAHPLRAARGLSVRRWSEKTIIVLVMQSLDNSLTTYRRRRRLGGHRLASRQGHGSPNPSWIPVGHDATRRLAERIGGEAGGTWGEVFNIPMTAHFIGGCPIGDSPLTGVVDPYQRLYGHQGLHVADGSALSANLGVNPSLSITAQAERAMALWPNKGQPDPRPPLGAAYERVAPVAPVAPVVPAGAPGELMLAVTLP
ncbi:MAG: GMC family oxidoreductase [Actinomycetota bacterium]|nr:GMC family oxidoreductase [Actinomycetota bacterium]